MSDHSPMNFDLYPGLNITPYNGKRVYAPQPASTTPPLVLPPHIAALLDGFEPTASFVRGKYAGSTFEEVMSKDPSYIRYILKECSLGVMRVDQNNLLRWLERKYPPPTPNPEA